MTVTVLPAKIEDEYVLNAYLGQRIRMIRIALGVSQQGLAQELGLTFQQIQKYERGRNRISASRLYEIGRVLGVDIRVFYEGLEEGAQGELPRRIKALTEAYERLSPQFGARELVELNQAFIKIPSRETRQKIIQLAELIAGAEAAHEAIWSLDTRAGPGDEERPGDDTLGEQRAPGKLALA